MRTHSLTASLALPLLLTLGACGGVAQLEESEFDVAWAYDLEQGELAFPGQDGPWRSSVFHLEEPVVLDYQELGGERIFEGDIILAEDAELQGEFGVAEGQLVTTLVSKRWPNATIPYVVDSSIPNKARITDAIAHWHAKTRVRFVKRTTQTDYVKIVRGTGCSSYVGRIGGAQTLNLADACSTGNTIHELGHAAGLWHEQSRSDRDGHVKIVWGNIQAGKESNFKTLSQLGLKGMNLGAYDFGSIMHYGSYYFSTNGKPTIVKKDGSPFEVNRKGLSARDATGIENLYTCQQTRFSDVCDSTFRGAIAWLDARGKAVGCASDRFCPNAKATRAETAAFLARGFELAAGPNAFTDDTGHKFEKDINALAAANVTKGCGDGKYCPERTLTRAEVATFLTRALNLPPGPDAFDDDNGTTHEKSINALAAAGITKGCGTRKYCPDQHVTRGQLAALVQRALVD